MGLIFLNFLKPNSCIYTGSVDMFVADLVKVYRLVISPALSTDIQTGGLLNHDPFELGGIYQFIILNPLGYQNLEMFNTTALHKF